MRLGIVGLLFSGIIFVGCATSQSARQPASARASECSEGDQNFNVLKVVVDEAGKNPFLKHFDNDLGKTFISLNMNGSSMAQFTKKVTDDINQEILNSKCGDKKLVWPLASNGFSAGETNDYLLHHSINEFVIFLNRLTMEALRNN